MARALGSMMDRGETGDARLALIRIPVGLIFLTQGILKFTDRHMGVVRFAHIGFPHPSFMAHFVGGVEIVCGLMVLAGLWTRLASVPLLVVISTAIVTTKIPELHRSGQGFWFMVSDARTDFVHVLLAAFSDSGGVEGARSGLAVKRASDLANQELSRQRLSHSGGAARKKSALKTSH